MRFADLVGQGLSALGQQKVRTGLTTLGVIIGTIVLLLSLSIGQGVRQAAAREVAKHHLLRKIRVYARHRPEEADIPEGELEIKGRMSEARRERLRQAKLARWRGLTKRPLRAPLTTEKIQEMVALEHVESVDSDVWFNPRAVFGPHSTFVTGISATPEDALFRKRIVAGDFFSSRDGRNLVIHEYLLYEWGVQDENQVNGVLGHKVRLEFRNPGRSASLMFLLNLTMRTLTSDEETVLDKAIRQLPAAIGKLELAPAEMEMLKRVLSQAPRLEAPSNSAQVVEEFTIAGVMRDPTREERMSWVWLPGADVDFLLPQRTAENIYLRSLPSPVKGFHSTQVTVDHEDHLETVEKQIEAMGFETNSLAEVVNHVRFTALLISFGTAFVGLVALMVASMGITNTMLMSVLERTHEIGVMKAVGARDRHIQMLFLVEGTLIGVMGGSLGLLFSWLASFPADAYARSLTETQTRIKLEESLFVFPWWLVLGVPTFVSGLTMLAAVYPARRAARVNPITALRHE